MIRILLAAGLASTAAVGAVHFRKAPPDLSSPKAAIRSFVGAINRQDASDMASCVKGGSVDELMQEYSKAPIGSKLELVQVIAETQDDKSTVAVEMKLGDYSFVELLPLVREGELWKVSGEASPNDTDLVAGSDRSAGMRHLLRFYARLAAHEPGIVAELGKSRPAPIPGTSDGRIKVIALGTALYVQDYDDLFPYPAKSYSVAISPYIKNLDYFKSPAAEPGETLSYSMNRNLEGVALSLVKEPMKTVLLYEGKNQRPAYRFEGRTAIAFVDGNAKLATEAEVKAYVWSDKAWLPAEPVKPKPRAKTKHPAEKKTRH